MSGGLADWSFEMMLRVVVKVCNGLVRQCRLEGLWVCGMLEFVVGWGRTVRGGSSRQLRQDDMGVTGPTTAACAAERA